MTINVLNCMLNVFYNNVKSINDFHINYYNLLHIKSKHSKKINTSYKVLFFII